ncbi:hypothetical protein [Sphingosinicella sp. BN140058]|uniref:hypothetical protein n=1 Tax=Sphingosinicella sp. BN140058 TaxID=1892855 RepID=UPI001012E116|nr:hypothetical protein [Sphingosinicella sp. BN140058]QAY77903.1 hypothetical protein ETR14_16280 [Sphingosinicella sp. BN140058]
MQSAGALSLAAPAGPAPGALPVCEAWVLPVAAARASFAALRPGERLLYARGPFLIRGETADFVREQYEAGLAHPLQPRSRACDGFDYLVEKIPQAPLRRGRRICERDDAATKAILGALIRAADRERICPTDADLARIAGLATRAQAKWRLAKLRQRGVIETAPVTMHPTITRVVTIVKTGRRTRAPEDARP